MRKQLFSVLLSVCLGNFLLAQSIHFSEDFSSGGLPVGWDNVSNNDFSTDVWTFGEQPALFGPVSTSTVHNGFAIMDSDKYGSGHYQDADLITPTINLSNETEVIVEFEHYYKSSTQSAAQFAYSIDNGNSWAVIETWDGGIRIIQLFLGGICLQN